MTITLDDIYKQLDSKMQKALENTRADFASVLIPDGGGIIAALIRIFILLIQTGKDLEIAAVGPADKARRIRPDGRQRDRSCEIRP